MYLLGYDCGTSSIKATLLDADTGKVIASASYPPREMPIISPQPGWAEQNPNNWWDNLKSATKILLNDSKIDGHDIKAIGISYQMHGLVCLDKAGQVLRPSIIWCDSRAVEIGNKATETIGTETILAESLNQVGNFTAAKLGWVKENEPDIYKKIHKIMLPGDYIGYKLTGQIATTKSGLSEGIFWNFQQSCLSEKVMNYFGFDNNIIPTVYDTFEVHGQVSSDIAAELGIKADTPVSYRAGDQPNNALSLGVMNPGQIAATAGTSAVVYGITNKLQYDQQSRVNTFIHVNNTQQNPSFGTLLCINGSGILNSWVKHNIANGLDYPEMNQLASTVDIGSDGLTILPYGNGAERSLNNQNIGGSFNSLNFNIHSQKHIFRAAQEGIAFALNYGVNIMKSNGVEVNTVRAGKANMFLSPVFAETFSTITNSTVELYNTDGSQGAARGAGLGIGLYKNQTEAFAGLECLEKIEPDTNNTQKYHQAYEAWLSFLASLV
ncbi:MAG: carbohydrate kinase [Phycisphaerae bacterium]|nr:carbohydrate kinase [Phycisphaerae bacterium]